MNTSEKMKIEMKNISTKIIILLSSLLFINTLNAQVAKSEYFMRTSYMRTSLNPALRPDQGHLVIPVLPNVGANIQTNSINLDNLTFRKEGKRVTFIHPSVPDNEFLKGISKNNYVRADVNYKIFAIGLFKDERYTSLDVGFRTHADVNLPRSVFELLKVGFDPNKEKAYDLKNISTSVQSFIEIGVAQSRPFLDNTLMLGARVKLLLGAGYADLNADRFDLEAGPEQWRSLSRVSLRGAAPGVRPKYNSKDQLDGFDFDWKGIPGYGAGIDIGAVYDVRKVLPVLDGLKVSIALNDIGFIRWSGSNSLSMSSSEQEVIVNPSSGKDQSTDSDKSLKDIMDDALDDLQKAIDLKEIGNRKGQSTSLRMNMNLGAEYEFIKHKLSVGALYSARYGNYYTSHEMTLSGNYQPLYWLGLTASYSFVHSAFDTFGLALHLAPRKGVTFFLASDYVIPHVSTQFIPTTSKGVNMQIGFSIPIGKVSSCKM